MTWFPSIPVGLFALLLAVLGAAVSVKEFTGWRRWAMASVFLLLGAGEMLAILKADKVHEGEVSELKQKLENIEKQTKTNHHAHVEFYGPTGVTDYPYLPFKAGEYPNIGILFYNASDQAISETFAGYGLNVAPHRVLSDAEEKDIWNQSTLNKGVAIGGPLYPRSPPHSNTVATLQPLTMEQANGLKDGTMSLCATSRISWKDETGGYSSMMFRCLYREPGTHKPPIFNWHIQGWNYNREERKNLEIVDSIP